jgi:hypothetical protein
MVRVLTGDVERLRPLLGARTIQAPVSDEEEANRRFYVRLILDLAHRKTVTLSEGVLASLSENTCTVTDSGTVVERGQYLQLQRKLRLLYRSAGEALG